MTLTKDLREVWGVTPTSVQGHSRGQKQVQCQKQEQVLPARSKQGSQQAGPDLEKEIKVRCNIRRETGCQVMRGSVVHNELSFHSGSNGKSLEELNRALVYYLHLNRVTRAAIRRSPQRDQYQQEGN